MRSAPSRTAATAGAQAAALLALAALGGCPDHGTTVDSRTDTGECTLADWDGFVDQVVPLSCKWRRDCSPDDFDAWWDTLEECEVDVRAQFENTREEVEDAGCGPFVVEAGCVALDCYAQLAEDCDASCDRGSADEDWFYPSCHTDY